MKHYVTYKVEARYIIEVEANSIEEAQAKADIDFSNANFGAACDIEGEAIMIENEFGDYIWEK